LELALGHPAGRSIDHRESSVSILVFLELALGLCEPRPKSPGRKGFNPCFLGTCPRTKMDQVLDGVPDSFNPCFLGTCPRT